MTEKTIRPGGERHGDLRTPHCGKGRGFAKADGLPAGRHSEEQHQGMRMLCEQNADLNDQLILHLRDISHMMRMQYEGKASQKRILIILRESGTLTQKELTERLGVSRPYLYKIFSNKFNMSPKQYIMWYKLNRAKEMLTEAINSD